jgi:hypothetical protein
MKKQAEEAALQAEIAAREAAEAAKKMSERAAKEREELELQMMARSASAPQVHHNL